MSIPCFEYSRVNWRSLAWATSKSVFESFASAVSLVWLTYCLVVLSLSAMAETEKPLLMSDQTVFCFWLSGEATEQVGLISGRVNK